MRAVLGAILEGAEGSTGLAEVDRRRSTPNMVSKAEATAMLATAHTGGLQ
jgi:hypothetical protein